jgi:RNA polymerase sigma factor (TIGR02999 family)
MAHEWRRRTADDRAVCGHALKLVGQHAVDGQNRAHFFAIASTMMRRILVDNARREMRPKHGAGLVSISMDDAPAVAQAASVDTVDTLALDAALKKLEALDPGQARIVELRFFGGLTVEETAEVVGSSPATVKREWSLAKGWLYRELTAGSGAS